ncbi:dihydrofolate reductase family protein [Micromonospora chaiyaphumensis]|uniref:Dihydrofolate reductase n=1 Tax=Micromonospora chaiyaphumensis TaxID=307119 RepID=A0A1C4U3B4_9ACTN|nr:dihydrofolate reductase family protein [Micromonospora chaiyaphumensis]SCE66134.1 Dihydrofolate reductase [Micromonospora chaiyaphumensis]
MRRIIVTENVSLDGVMQAPGRPDEDTRDGFTRGGWAVPFNDPVLGRKMGEGMASTGALLLGRRTWADFAGYWPRQTGNPFTPVLDALPKYVASTTLDEPLPWVNSHLLKGDVIEAVRELKAQPGPDIAVLGSGELVRSLRRHGLVDAYVLLVHPLVLGGGRRLFDPGDEPDTLRLTDSVTTTTGVVIARYEPA